MSNLEEKTLSSSRTNRLASTKPSAKSSGTPDAIIWIRRPPP